MAVIQGTAIPSTGELIRLNSICTLGNQTALFRSDFLVGTLIAGGTTVGEIADNFSSLMGPVIKPFLASNAAFYGVECRVISVKPQPVPGYGNSTAGAGTSITTCGGSQLAGVVTKQTPFAGRAYRGRSFIPFIPYGGIDSSSPPILTVGQQTQLDAVAQVLTFPWVSLTGGRSTGLSAAITKTTAGIAVFTAPVITYRANFRIGTQRKRGDYGRPNAPPF